MKKIIILCISIVLIFFFSITYFVDKDNYNDLQIQDSGLNNVQNTLTILASYESYEHQQMLLNLADGFESTHKGKKVKIIFAPYEDYAKRLLIEHARGKLADLVIVENSMMPSLVSADVFDDITNFVVSNDFHRVSYTILWGTTMDNGKYYGMPFTCSAYSLFYNKNILNYYDAQIPETWEDLKKVSKKIFSSGADSFGISAKQTGEATNQFLQLLYSTGGSMQKIDSQDGIKAFKLLEDMRKDGTLARNCINWSERDLTIQFAKGEVAIMLNSCNQIPELENKKTSFEWGICPLPSEGNRAAVVCGENIGITKNANYNNAIEFLEYINTTECLKQIALQYGGIPLRPDITNDFISNNIGVDKIYANQMEYAFGKEPYRLWPNISESFENGLFDLLNSSKSSEEVSQEIQTLVSDYIISG